MGVDDARSLTNLILKLLTDYLKDGDPEEAPDLRGVFDTFEEAEAELATEGSVADGEKHV